MSPEEEITNALAVIASYYTKARQIAETVATLRKTGRVTDVKIDEDGLSYEYNSSCNCHPEYRREYLPLSYLWTENYAELEQGERDRLQKERDDEQAARKLEEQKEKDAEEKAEYERLQAKFKN